MSFLRKTLSLTSLFVAGLVGFSFVGCESGGSGGNGGAMTTLEDSVSYAIGMNFGSQLKQGADNDSIAFNIDLIRAGVAHGFADTANRRFPDSVGQQVLMSFQTMMMAKMQAKQQQMQQQDAGPNKEMSEAFLAENKDKPGVKTTASGLQYIVEKEGKGDSPSPTDVVSVNYRGTLIDGTEFDASKGQPVEFPVNGVIPGWTEALQLMKPGAKYKLFIPSELAYGVNPPPGSSIKPNDALIFEVELLSVKKP